MIPAYTPNRKILYIDDEIGLLDTFKALFRKDQIEVFVLQYPEMINKILSSFGPFSVIISDERMPNLSGHKLLEIVKSQFPNTQRLLVTGYASLEDTINAVNYGGINKYISKPWKDEELKKIILESVDYYNIYAEKDFLIHYAKSQNIL